MMNEEFENLRKAYAAELRESKDAAERWWKELTESFARKPDGPKPEDLWPMGPVSHPWVIATYRKYFFQCVELNTKTLRSGAEISNNRVASEEDWGSEDDASSTADTIEPKVFVLDLLSGGDTHDLYEFLLSLVLIPIGLKADELV